MAIAHKKESLSAYLEDLQIFINNVQIHVMLTQRMN